VVEGEKKCRQFSHYAEEEPQEDTMVIHQREVAYTKDYPVFFEALVKAKAYLEQKHPEVSVLLMYNLAGERGWATIQTSYPSLADYERIDAEMDRDEIYSKLLSSLMEDGGEGPVDQFFRVIKGS
jgi:hypothetical protein